MNISTLDFHSGDQSLNPTEVNSFFFEKLCLKRTKIQKGPFLKSMGMGPSTLRLFVTKINKTPLAR